MEGILQGVFTQERNPTRVHTVLLPSVGPATLQTHIRVVHADDRPYVCDVCDKRFTQSRHLNRHRRVHRGEKPYTCPRCPASFSRPSKLQTNTKAVDAGDRPYVCDKRFTQSRHLNRHRHVHRGEKPYTCPHCPASFSRPSKLQTHNRVVNLWNSLPDNVVTAPSVDSFKRRLDKHWAALPSMYDPECLASIVSDLHHPQTTEANFSFVTIMIRFAPSPDHRGQSVSVLRT